MHPLDISILVLFLATTLLLGMYASKGIQDPKSFAVGNRNFGSYALFATLSASYIGGGYTFGLAEKTVQHGFLYILCLLGVSLQQFLVTIVIIPRMKPFKDAYSIGDIMEKFYGKSGKLFSGLAGVVVCTGIIGAQVNAMGYIFNVFLGMDQTTGILIGCSIVIAYSVLGGMRAVVLTDIFQFAVLIIAIPLTLILGILALGDIDVMTTIISQKDRTIPNELPWLTLLSLFLSLLIGEALVPPYVQRLFITKTVRQTQKGTLWSSLVSIPFFFMIGTIGLIALTLDPGLNPHMALPAVIEAVLPIGLKGVAIAGIIAVVMSSADSFLNAAAVGTIHDIIKPLQKRPMDSKSELFATRLCTLLIGVAAITFALKIESVLDILLYSYNFWAPIILVPFVGGVLGKRTSQAGFIFSMLSGISTVIFWNIYFAQSTGFDGLVVGVGANLIAFTISIHLHKKSQHNTKIQYTG